MPASMQQRFIAYVESIGETFVKQTSKYHVYTCKSGGFYYIGRNGGLRVGKSVVASFPVNDATKKRMLTSPMPIK